MTYCVKLFVFVKRGAKRTREQAEQEDSEDENDEVKLHQDGWKDRYYSTKFHVPASDIQFRKTLVSSSIYRNYLKLMK